MNKCYDCMKEGKHRPIYKKDRRAIGGMILCKKHYARRRGRSPLRRRAIDWEQCKRLKPKKEDE